MIKIEDLLFVTPIPIGARKHANQRTAISGVIDTVHPTNFSRARRCVVIPRRTGAGSGNGFTSGLVGNSSLRIGIRSASASTTSYTTASLLPTTVSATALTASGAVYAYNIKLDGVKRYLNVYMSCATTSGTWGCDALLCEWETVPVTQPKASSPLTSKYGFNSITHIPSNP
jgi:hypothetical protein